MTIAIETTGHAVPAGIAPARWARLQDFIGAMTPAAAGKLFSTLEAAAMRGLDQGLPTGAMLAALRVRLAADRAYFPDRPPSAQRLFFAPFEDFLVTHRRGRKRRARIARASLAPIWQLILDDAALGEARAAMAALNAAIARGEPDLAPLRHALCTAAALGFSRLIAHAESDHAFRADLGARLAPGAAAQTGVGAGAAALLDLAELAVILPANRHFAGLQQSFKKPVAALSEEMLYDARGAYARVAADANDAAPYLLLLIAARMEAPWRALSLVHHIAGIADEALPHAREDAEILLETLFDDLESLARQLERGADDDLEPEEAAAGLAYFAEQAAGMIGEARLLADAVAVNRVEACRDIAAAALARCCEQAHAAIRRTQPVRHAGGSSRLMALRPDVERAIDARAQSQARHAAHFLSDAGSLAQRLGRPGAVAGLVAEAIAETRRYAGDLVVEIRAAEGAERATARRRMEMTLDCAGPLIAPTDLALLKERAAAAAVSA